MVKLGDAAITDSAVLRPQRFLDEARCAEHPVVEPVPLGELDDGAVALVLADHDVARVPPPRHHEVVPQKARGGDERDGEPRRRVVLEVGEPDYMVPHLRADADAQREQQWQPLVEDVAAGEEESDVEQGEEKELDEVVEAGVEDNADGVEDEEGRGVGAPETEVAISQQPGHGVVRAKTVFGRRCSAGRGGGVHLLVDPLVQHERLLFVLLVETRVSVDDVDGPVPVTVRDGEAVGRSADESGDRGVVLGQARPVGRRIALDEVLHRAARAKCQEHSGGFGIRAPVGAPHEWGHAVLVLRVDAHPFGHDVGHDGSEPKLRGQVDPGAALSVLDRGVGPVLHE